MRCPTLPPASAPDAAAVEENAVMQARAREGVGTFFAATSARARSPLGRVAIAARRFVPQPVFLLRQRARLARREVLGARHDGIVDGAARLGGEWPLRGGRRNDRQRD